MVGRNIGKRFADRNRTIGARGYSSYPNNPPTRKLPIAAFYLSFGAKSYFLCAKVGFLTKLYRLSRPLISEWPMYKSLTAQFGSFFGSHLPPLSTRPEKPGFCAHRPLPLLAKVSHNFRENRPLEKG